VQVRVLGPTEVTRDEHPVDLGTRKQRALVAALVLHGGRAVGVDTLVDLLWGDAPPASVGGTLHAYVAGLRRALEPDRPPRAAATLLVTVDGGYALRLPADAVDARRFDDGVTQVHRRLHAGRGPDEPPGVPVELTAAELAALDDRLSVLLDDWHGTPYAELDDAAAAVAERSRLEELRLLALEDRALLRLVLGQSSTVVGELEQLTGEHPLRESLWAAAGHRPGSCRAPGRRAVRAAPGPAHAVGRARDRPRSSAAAARGGGPAPGAARRRASGAPGPAPAAPGRPGRPAPRSVGRDGELAALEALLPPALGGQTQLAVLVGEAGIGKSRLAAAFAERAEAAGFAVAAGECSEAEGAPPLWPWSSVFGALREQQLLDGSAGAGALDLLSGSAESTAPRSPPLALGTAAAPASTATADDAAAAQFRVWDALTEQLCAAAAARPLLLVLEDLHWSDTSSARLLRHVVDRVHGARLVVLVTRRRHPEPSAQLADLAASMGRRHALQLGLAGLDAEATGQHVAALDRRRAGRRDGGAAARTTDGNPFVLVELMRWTAAPTSLTDVPAGVTDVVARRVAALPVDTAGGHADGFGAGPLVRPVPLSRGVRE
jgi:DNA-binding SARP family transcriptional activator